MEILELSLENIKSYRAASIRFENGINAVCGLNGSGKTTVLEAIGFAIFDYLPYNQQAFVREGEKSGTVRVRVRIDDDREYEITRRIGSGSPWYVFDVELNEKIAERGENVLDWIRTHALNIEESTDLRALFKDAVGVPQGQMTGHFLDKSTQRKAVFDPLLRVEEYGVAWSKLRDVTNYLQNLQGIQREDIARLEGVTSRIEPMERELGELRVEADGIERDLERLRSEAVDVRTRREQLDAAEINVRDQTDAVKRAEMDVDHLKSTLEQMERDLESSRRARQIVEESKTGYTLVIEAGQTLQILEQRRKERDALQNQLSAEQEKRNGIVGRIETLDGQIEEAVRAQDAASTLIEAVVLQTELERQLQNMAITLGDAPRLDRQIEQTASAFEKLRDQVAAREKQIHAARAAEDEARRLPEIEAESRAVVEKLAAFSLIRSQLSEVAEEGRVLRSRNDALEQAQERRERLVARIAALQVQSEQLASLSDRYGALREARAAAAATINYREVARAQLAQGHCPLLELPCPVVSKDISALRRFDDHAAELELRVTNLDRDLTDIAPSIETARQSTEELQTLRVEMATIASQIDRDSEVPVELARCRDLYKQLSQVLAEEESLTARGTHLAEEIRVSNLRAEEARRLPLLVEQLGHDRDRLGELETTLSDARVERAALLQVQHEQVTLEQRLNHLDDPRGRQQTLLAVGQLKPNLQHAVQQERQNLAEVANVVTAFVTQLEDFASLEAQFEEQHGIVLEHSEAHKRYLSAHDAASALGARQQALELAQTGLENARRQEQDARRLLERALERYDRQTHLEVKSREDVVGKLISARGEAQTRVQRDMDRLERELAALRRDEVKLRACRAELSKLEELGHHMKFVRDTIRAAGPAITETLLANISHTANDIFAEIMDDHAAELRWDREYEILVQRGADERKFAQLSGGEQMSAALSVRLALLKEMSEVNFAFFDEPTQNMDVDRRTNLADQIQSIRGFDQLIVISHDDTFEHHTDNVIRLRKSYEATEVEN